MTPPEYLSSAAARDVTARLEKIQNELRHRPATLSATWILLQRIGTGASDALRAVQPKQDGELRYWLNALVEQCRLFGEELKSLAPWVELSPPGDLGLLAVTRKLDEPTTLLELAGLETVLQSELNGAESEYLRKVREAIGRGAEQAAGRLDELKSLAVRCRELADVEYEFLYDQGRRLLALGYHATDHRLDAGFYDLLASEARLASFVAIAQGKLPQEHWFSLGRHGDVGGGKAGAVVVERVDV